MERRVAYRAGRDCASQGMALPDQGRPNLLEWKTLLHAGPVGHDIMLSGGESLDGQGALGGEGSEPGDGSVHLVELCRAAWHIVNKRG